MFVSTIKRRLIFLSISFFICNIVMFIIFQKIFYSTNIIIDFAIHPFNICEKYPDLWKFIKITYVISFNIAILIISNLIYSAIFNKEKNITTDKNISIESDNISESNLTLLVGKDENNNLVYIDEKGLYQNILITGTIGSGKTSSAMYPFTKQLIEYKCDNKYV